LQPCGIPGIIGWSPPNQETLGEHDRANCTDGDFINPLHNLPSWTPIYPRAVLFSSSPPPQKPCRTYLWLERHLHRTMGAIDSEKTANAAKEPVVTVRGDVTPISDSGDVVSVDEADKILRELGYTPVSHGNPYLSLASLCPRPRLTFCKRYSSASSQHGPASVSR